VGGQRLHTNGTPVIDHCEGNVQHGQERIADEGEGPALATNGGSEARVNVLKRGR